MKRKIILACLILAVAVATIGVASALSTQINLPDGYEIDEAQSYSNNTTFMGVDCECNHAVMVNVVKKEYIVKLTDVTSSFTQTIIREYKLMHLMQT